MKQRGLAYRFIGATIGGLAVALGATGLLPARNVAWADEPSINELKAEVRALKRQVERLEPLRDRLDRLEARLAAQGAGAMGVSDGKIHIDETRWLKIGGGLRTSFKSVEDSSPDGGSYSKDFAVENMRLYTNSQLRENIQVEFNTDIISDTSGTSAELRILDAVVKLNHSDAFNVWAGRFLPPSDRSNLDGPYYLATWDFPFVSNYPAIFAGRDDGAMILGTVDEGRFKYAFGAFEATDGAPNGSDNLLYATRLAYNFWDPMPGYYTQSTYYGAKDVFEVGLVSQWQKDGAGTSPNGGNFFGSNIDVLIEKTLDDFGGGVGTLEGAYYVYDLNHAADTTLIEGNAFMLLAGYLLPDKLGPGQLQPHVRYQNFNDHRRMDFGVNYVIDGHNARLSAVYSIDDPGDDTAAGTSFSDNNRFLLGGQFQF